MCQPTLSQSFSLVCLIDGWESRDALVSATSGGCQRPEKPHSCGATVWIETLATATVFNFDGTVERVNSMWIWEEEEMWEINKKNIEQLIQEVS